MSKSILMTKFGNEKMKLKPRTILTPHNNTREAMPARDNNNKNTREAMSTRDNQHHKVIDNKPISQSIPKIFNEVIVSSDQMAISLINTLFNKFIKQSNFNNPKFNPVTMINSLYIELINSIKDQLKNRLDNIIKKDPKIEIFMNFFSGFIDLLQQLYSGKSKHSSWENHFESILKTLPVIFESFKIDGKTLAYVKPFLSMIETIFINTVIPNIDKIIKYTPSQYHSQIQMMQYGFTMIINMLKTLTNNTDTIKKPSDPILELQNENEDEDNNDHGQSHNQTQRSCWEDENENEPILEEIYKSNSTKYTYTDNPYNRFSLNAKKH